MKPLSPEEFRRRFDARVDRSGGLDACWPWTGAIFISSGYGQATYQRVPKGAHRVAFFLHHGYWPNVARHSCDDNKVCVNPAHILDGTDSDNQRDAVERGRHWHTRKTHCKHGHEFTPENTYPVRAPSGRMSRSCRQCRRDVQRRARQRLAGPQPVTNGRGSF